MLPENLFFSGDGQPFLLTVIVLLNPSFLCGILKGVENTTCVQVLTVSKASVHDTVTRCCFSPHLALKCRWVSGWSCGTMAVPSLLWVQFHFCYPACTPSRIPSPQKPYTSSFQVPCLAGAMFFVILVHQGFFLPF